MLDQWWDIMVQLFYQILKNSTKREIIIPKIGKVINRLHIYTDFDYTNSKKYKENFQLFQDLNEKIYNNVLRNNLSEKQLSLYIESLVSLNIYVGNAFLDFLKLNPVSD